VVDPYPCAIDLDKLFEVNAGLIDPVAYVWGRSQNFQDTPSSGNSGPDLYNYNPASYLIYNPSMTINPNPFNSDPNTGISVGTLASCQSFFVTTIDNNPNYSYHNDLVFNNSMRKTLPNNTFAKQSSHDTGDKLWLNLLDNSATKIMQIGIAF